ncbi:MAG: plasmid pRiA4b ORF-3 family protein [Gemmataceae bacterium]|nr:plasmid pRiA4b ORF-3 family protein [Gemmataceae bacterium]
MKRALTFTREHEQILRGQVIDPTHPGPILHDFQAALDFVGPEGVKAGGKYNLLPISAVDELDQQLARPLRLRLKRPQIKSHPYLMGLNLLLRATGLTRVEGAGDKARLALDPTVLAAWNALNPTERYFTLLEAWLHVGRGEMVGERDRWGDGFLQNCLMGWQSVPAAGKKLDTSRPQEARYWGGGPGFHHLALMDLFGLMEVEHPKKPPQPWCPAAVKHLPFGDAVFLLVGGKVRNWLFDLEAEDESDDEESRPEGFGRWQPIFQPYFPEWRNNLVVPEEGPRDGVFVFKVALGKVWRKIAIPARLTLEDLAGAILDSVDFDDDHLYEFTYRNRLGATVRVSHPYCDEGPFTPEIEIGELPLNPGQSMTFLFDFGDNWQFNVLLEQIDPPNPRMKKPKLIESHGKAPPQYPDWDDE